MLELALDRVAPRGDPGVARKPRATQTLQQERAPELRLVPAQQCRGITQERRVVVEVVVVHVPAALVFDRVEAIAALAQHLALTVRL